jgi:hypothetical protein
MVVLVLRLLPQVSQETRVRSSIPFALMIAAVSLATPAAAAEITLDGYTNGCFYTGTSCVPANSDAPQSANTQGLTFSNVGFDGTTISGDLPLTLGSFDFDPNGNVAFGGWNFNLRVSFDAPLGLDLPSAVLTAVLTGTASGAPGQCSKQGLPAPCGSVVIDFDNNPIPFSFTNGNATGSFFLTVSDLTVFAGQTDIALAGRISGASQTVLTTPNDPRQAPEPATLALFGVGLFALAAGVRRSRKR